MTSTHTESAMLDGGPSGDAGYGRVSPKGLDTSHGAILYLAVSYTHLTLPTILLV